MDYVALQKTSSCVSVHKRRASTAIDCSMKKFKLTSRNCVVTRIGFQRRAIALVFWSANEDRIAHITIQFGELDLYQFPLYELSLEDGAHIEIMSSSVLSTAGRNQVAFARREWPTCIVDCLKILPEEKIYFHVSYDPRPLQQFIKENRSLVRRLRENAVWLERPPQASSSSRH